MAAVDRRLARRAARADAPPRRLWAIAARLGFGAGFTLVLDADGAARAPTRATRPSCPGMAQSVGYTLAAIGPVAIGALHDVTGGWTVPLVVLVALARVLDAGASRCARRAGRAFVGAAHPATAVHVARRRAPARSRSRHTVPMPARLPDGDPAPADGALPRRGAARARRRGRSAFYVHVPFCASRCGYCDFNTYMPGELRRRAARGGYVGAVLAEIDARARACSATRAAASTRSSSAAARRRCCRPPSCAGSCARIDERFGLAPGAEVTTEANPESVDPGQARGAARGRLHAHLARDAERRAARAGDARPRPHARPRGSRPSPRRAPPASSTSAST